jgi:predicted transcriptional regulator
MAYTSAMTLCKRMANRGLVNYRQQDRAYVYSAAVKRHGVLKRMLGGIIDRAFGGSEARMAMSVLADARIDPAELAELQKLLQSKQQELQQRGKAK